MRTCLTVILAQFNRDLNCDLFLFRPSWNTPGLFFMTIIRSNTNWSWPFSVKFRSLLRRVQQLLAHLFFQSFKLCFGRNGKLTLSKIQMKAPEEEPITWQGLAATTEFSTWPEKLGNAFFWAYNKPKISIKGNHNLQLVVLFLLRWLWCN